MLKNIYIISLLLSASSISAETLKVVTTDFPPYQIMNNGKIEGISTEIVKEVIKGAGFTADIKAYPWPRAYKIAQNEKNVIIYSIVKNDERANLFKWIGTIAPYDVYFWKLKERNDIKIETLEDAKKYLIGGVNYDIKAIFLEREGFQPRKNLTLVNNDELNLKMLHAKKIDLLPADEFSFPFRVKKYGYQLDEFDKSYKIKGMPHELLMAASLQTADDVVNKLKKSLMAFQKSKKYKKLQVKMKS